MEVDEGKQEVVGMFVEFAVDIGEVAVEFADKVLVEDIRLMEVVGHIDEQELSIVVLELNIVEQVLNIVEQELSIEMLTMKNLKMIHCFRMIFC